MFEETNSGIGSAYDIINRTDSTNTNIGKTDGDKTSIASARFPSQNSIF